MDGNVAATDTTAFQFNEPTAGTYDVMLIVEDVTSYVDPTVVGSTLTSSRTWIVEVPEPGEGPVVLAVAAALVLSSQLRRRKRIAAGRARRS